MQASISLTAPFKEQQMLNYDETCINGTTIIKWSDAGTCTGLDEEKKNLAFVKLQLRKQRQSQRNKAYPYFRSKLIVYDCAQR